MTPITFRIPGEPVAWARAGHAPGGFSFTPKVQRQFGALVKAIAQDSLPADWQLIDGPVALSVECVFARPASRCRKKDRPHERDWCVGRKDWDNCGKIVSDALNGIVWKDDRQVVRGWVNKLLGRQNEPPHVEVMIFPLRAGPVCREAESEATLFVESEGR